MSPTRAIKTRHILYSPKDDAQGAADVPDTDPSWDIAKTEAEAAYVKLLADPSLFDSIARAESDEASATGASGTGGKLPYFDKDSEIDEAFKAAITAEGLKPGDLIAPIKSAFGWHVIQVMYGPTDRDHLDALKTQADAGADFGVLARDNSEAPDASSGGDIGWVAKGQFDELATAAIFAAPVGKTSSVVSVAGRRDLPVQGLRGGDPGARRPPARDDQGQGLRRLVHAQEGRRYHHP